MRLVPFARNLVLVVLFVVVGSSARAQSDPNLMQGLTPFATFDGGNLDRINVANGNLYFHALLFSLPQRGGILKFSESLQSNNKGWFVKYTTAGNGGTDGTWTPATGSRGVYPTANVGVVNDGFPGVRVYTTGLKCDTQWTYNVQEPDGSLHYLGIAGATGSEWPECDKPESRAFMTGDGSAFTYNNSTGVLIDRAGVTYASPTEDPNGNQISGNSTGTTDTVGRNITSVLFATSTTNYSGCTGPLPIASASLWTVPAPGGVNNTFKLCYALISVQTNFKWGVVTEANIPNQSFLQSIVLPDGQAWTFQYNSRAPGDPASVNYADLTEITLPTGGTISYTYINAATPGCTPTSGCSVPVSRYVATRTVNANDGTGPHTSTYQWNPSSSTSMTTTVTDPMGNDTVYTIQIVPSTQSYSEELERQIFQGLHTTGTLLKTIQTVWATGNGSTSSTIGFPIRSTVIWPNGLQTKTERDYNYEYGQVLTQREYDYGNGAPGPLLRTTNTAYVAPSNSTYLTNNLLNLTSSVQVLDGNGVQRAYTTFGYDEYQPLNPSGITTQHDSAPPDGNYRGNRTSVHRWLNGSTVVTTNCNISVSNSYLVSYVTYNDTGTTNTTVDSCGSSSTDTTHMTTFAYSPTYAGAYPTSVTNPLNQITSHTYDFNSGLLISTTDPNNQTASFTYDNIWRIASASYPDGGQSTLCYSDTGGSTCTKSGPPFSATLTKKITSSQSYSTTNIFDGLGRISQNQQADPQGTVYTDTTYDADGRKASVSNPYRAKTDPTYGVTSYVYDGIGRTCVVVPPDGTASGPTCPTTQPSNDVFTTFLGNTTTVTDQQVKSRTSQTDGLGRLTNVWEDPNGLNYQTVYAYDALDDLAGVAQGGSRNRNFVFDSLKHMTSSTNPEASTVTYAYDADGNVITKADARSITLTYSYDTLNRMVGRTYSNGDPSVGYAYDQATCIGQSPCFNIGRRTSVSDAGGSESFSYDQMGREWGEQRTTSGAIKATSYTYNLDGSLATLTYPSGRLITYTTDSAGRPSDAQDLINGVNYVEGTCPNGSPGSNGGATTGACYAPQGAVMGLAMGKTTSFTGITLSNSYNTRFQPNEFLVSSSAGAAMVLTYSFLDANSHNNGNVMAIANNLDGTRSESFAYDSLNRVTSAQTLSTYATGPNNCWGESYQYDNQTTGGEWGNLTSIGVLSSAYNGCTQESLSVTATANNQLSATGFTYDAAGNMTADSVNSYGFNAESEIKSAAGVNYTYDGDGNRVQKSNGKIYWYGAGTEILDESDGSGNITDEYVFFGGKRMAHRVVSSGSISYYAEDFLGSSRVITTSAGTPCYAADFYPYGGERIITNTCAQNYKFEGKERDTETGNDDFGARYYASRLGRWLSSDWSSVPAPVPYADLTNPQTLNLYAMVRDNPETFADLDGHAQSGDELKPVMQDPDPQEKTQEIPPQKPSVPPPQQHGRLWNLLHTLGFVNTPEENAAIARQNALRFFQNGIVVDARGHMVNPATLSTQQLEALQAEYWNSHCCQPTLNPGMLGWGGTQVTSHTLWESEDAHIDVENPSPGQRPGQIHYQDDSGKYIYDLTTRSFRGAPNEVNELLGNEDVQRAIQTGLKYLGVSQ